MACCLKNRVPSPIAYFHHFLRMLRPFLYEEVEPLITILSPADQFLSTLFVALALRSRSDCGSLPHFYDPLIPPIYLLVTNVIFFYGPVVIDIMLDQLFDYR